MRNTKKVFLESMTVLLTSATFASVLTPSIVNASSVSTSTVQPTKQSSKETTSLSSEIQSNLNVTQTYDNTVMVTINDTPELRQALKENNSSYAELNHMVGQINNYFRRNKSDIQLSLLQLYTTSKRKKKNNSGTCSKALQFIGYVHSGAYYVAAAMLGVTGPASVIVPLLVGLIYQAGALFC